MRPHYFKQIFPATEIKRQTPCGARDEGARKLTLCFRGVSNSRSHSEMHSSSRCPAPHVFALSPPSPPGPPQSLLGTAAATYPSAPALQAVQLPEGATSNPGLRCGVVPGPPPALLHTHTRGACRAGQPPARLRDGVPSQAGPAPQPPGGRAPLEVPFCHRRGPLGRRLATPPRRPSRSPPVPAPQRAALRRRSAGQPPGERPAKGSPRAGSERSGPEGCAGSPRPTYFVFSPNSLCYGRQPPPRGGRGGQSLTGVYLHGKEEVRTSPTGRGAPLSPAAPLPSERAERHAAVGDPLPRATCQPNGTRGSGQPPPPPSRGSLSPRLAALSAPLTGENRS